MTSDGHDTSVTVAGVWLRSFLEPLLNDECFMENTLILITFDENETYTIRNTVFSVLLGDAVPEHLVGTTDNNYYNHYSEIATVEANWCVASLPPRFLPLPTLKLTPPTRNLHTLGRWDVGANVFANVAKETGDQVRKWSGPTPFADMYFNTSYPGIFNTAGDWAPQPVPNSFLFHDGRSVLPSIQREWFSQVEKSYYNSGLETPDGAHPPVYPKH